MSELKKENVKKCVSLLRAFVEESSALDNQKQRAILALNQLQKITAGTDSVIASGDVFFLCLGRPRIDN
ncbi:MAG: hypothetical protein JSV88_27195 [Candidatus Aminicenantes bacterium]|nr:MAG: hypothetical protein JSV88_27195 [Candidatus Aminicenantes bacterium]